MGLAFLCAIGGIRSLWIWGRRRFEGTDVAEVFLYTMFLTGRIGLWFAFAGLFVLYAMSDSLERGIGEFRWYLLVLVGLSAAQFVGSQLLGRRTPNPARPSVGEPREPGAGGPLH